MFLAATTTKRVPLTRHFFLARRESLRVTNLATEEEEIELNRDFDVISVEAV